MAWANKKFENKREFYLDRLSMSLGSLANLYSHSQNPPKPNEIFEEAMKLTDKIWSFGQRYDDFPELEEKLKERFEHEEHEKKIGRYSASEIWGLLNGKIPPEKYLEPREFDEESKRKMFFGIIIHDGIQKLFEFKEKKYEIEIEKGVVIVCKIDLEIGNKIFEFKTREDLEAFEEVPSWYLLQVQCYLEAKDLDEMKLYLIGWGLTRRSFTIKRDKKTFEYIKNGLLNYHKRVVKGKQKEEPYD